MKSNTHKTLERIDIFQYELILEGIAVGILTGLVVSMFRLALEKADVARNWMLAYGSQGINRGLLTFLALSILVFAVILCLNKEPLCSGSGIPQVKGEMKGQIEAKWWRVILCKFIGGVAAIGGGLSLGREGPSIQLGAMVGKGFSRLTKRLRTEEKMLMTCGAGAGLAGAFCAPLAGVVFALEELHKNFSTDILLSTMAAAVSSDFVSSYIFGLEPVFDLSLSERLPLSKYWMIICLGIILGAFGVFYNFTIRNSQNILEKIKNKNIRLIIPFIFVILFAIFYPEVLGGGHGIVGQVGRNELVISSLIILLILKFIFSVLSFGSGAPGGIFLPLLVLGAITGGVFAQLAGLAFDYDDMYMTNFVILGMAGYFSAIVRAPVTGVILITEMTGDFNSLLSLAIVALVSYVTADLLKGVPIYDQLLDRMLAKQKGEETLQGKKVHKVILESDVYLGSKMDGEKIEKMLLPPGCLVVSVIRDGKEFVPCGSTELLGGDKLVILCAETFVHSVEEKLTAICKIISR